MEDIKIVRLKSGEDIVGYINEDNEKITISYPMVIDLIKTGGVQSFTIQSWMPHQLFKLNEASIWLNDVLMISEVADEFVEYYLQMVDRLTKYIAAEEIISHLQEEEMIMSALEERESNILH